MDLGTISAWCSIGGLIISVIGLVISILIKSQVTKISIKNNKVGKQGIICGGNVTIDGEKDV